MKITATIETIDATRWQRAIDRALDSANEWGADEYARQVAANIAAGNAPDGSKQTPNPDATAKAKRKRWGHSTPLVDTGHLSTATNWVKRKEGKAWIVEVPTAREKAWEAAEKHGYKVDGAPKGFKEAHGARQRAELLKAERIVKANLIKRSI